MVKLLVDTADLLTVPEVMNLLNIGYATVYRWIKKRTIVSVSLGGKTYVPRSEVERILAEREVVDG